MSVSKSVVLAESIDTGIPGPAQFRTEEVLAPTAVDCKDGDILVQLIAISADPYLRGSIKRTGSVKPGDVMKGFVVGKVVASNNCPRWAVGDFFGSNLPFTSIQLLKKDSLESLLMWKLTNILDETNISIGLGIITF